MFLAAWAAHPLYMHFGTTSALAPLPGAAELFAFFVLVKIGSIVTFDLTHRVIHDRKAVGS